MCRSEYNVGYVCLISVSYQRAVKGYRKWQMQYKIVIPVCLNRYVMPEKGPINIQGHNRGDAD